MEDDTASVEIDENPFSFKNFMKNQIILDGSVSDTNSSSNSFIDQKADDRKDTTEEVPFPNVNRDLEAIPATKKKGKGNEIGSWRLTLFCTFWQVYFPVHLLMDPNKLLEQLKH